MGPPRKSTVPSSESSSSQRITSYLDADQQPPWAKRMEENIMGQLTDINASISIVDKRTLDLENRVSELERKLNETEFHQRKYNLLFYGLKFQPTDCEEKVRGFIRDDLELGEDVEKSMAFQHCHPLPASGTGTACIVRFVNFRDKDRIMRSLGKLKGKNCKVSVRSDLPKPQREKRKDLLLEMRNLRNEDRSLHLRIAEKGLELHLEKKNSRGRWEKLA